jgi:sugar lactone lactonase YvrE
LPHNIVLQYTGIPVVSGLKISYDTLKQIVTLSWNKLDTALVKSFNIYRTNVDSNTISTMPINKNPITDTIYRDFSGIQDQTYAYRVAAVNKNTTEGTKCAGVQVKVVVAFIFLKDFGIAGNSVGQFSAPIGITADKNGNFWITDHNRKKVMEFDSLGLFLKEWGIAGTDSTQLNNPSGIDIDAQGKIWVSNWYGSRIQKFDTAGKFILSIDSSGMQILSIAVDENSNVYFSELNSRQIWKCTPNGIFIKSWQVNSQYIGTGLLARNGKIFVTGSSDIVGQTYGNTFIEVFDTLGNSLQQIVVRRAGETGAIGSWDIDIDNKGNIYLSDPEKGLIRVFDKDGNFITTFGRKGNSAGEFSWIQGIAISLQNRIAITDRTYIHLLQLP